VFTVPAPPWAALGDEDTSSVAQCMPSMATDDTRQCPPRAQLQMPDPAMMIRFFLAITRRVR
jgi:hypothetical protein